MNNLFKLILAILFVVSSQAYAQVVAADESSETSFNEEEKNWIDENPVINFTGDPNWLPFEAFDKNGHYVGIVADHLKLIEETSGLKLKKVVTKNWTESTNKAKNKQVAILSETDDSALASHLNFTDSYLTNVIVIAMRHDSHYTENIDKIKNKKIALIKDYGYATKIRQKYKYINFQTVNDINDGLSAVSTGKVDALLCTLALCSYTIAQMGISNVKITGKTEFDTKLAFGIQKDLPVLLSIFNKSIKQITKIQQQEILKKWINPDEKAVDYTLFYRALIFGSILLFLILLWNRRLSNEVYARKKVEIVLEQKQKQLEGLLEGQRDTINLLFDNSSFGFAFCDMSGLMIDINDRFSKITGYEIDELKKLTYWELTPEKFAQEETEQLKMLEETGSYGPYRKEYIRKDGAHVPVELNGFIIENYNGVRGIFSLIEDISERIAIDEKIEIQRKKLLHSSKLASIGEMAAGVGHEINNPLAISAGNVTLTKRYLSSKNFTDEKVDEYLESIAYANERIRKIVDGLKLYSRSDSSDYSPVSLKKVIEETLGLTTEIYAKEGVILSAELKEDNLFIQGSLGELQQVLINLLSNAKDATEDISDRNIVIKLVKDDDRALLSVQDNGSGIPEDIKDNIFNPFFTTKEIGKGTGLGLGLAYELVTKVGGEISIDSEVGSGTTVSVYLPLIEAKLEQVRTSSENLEPVKYSGKVLVVDDEAEIRKILVEALTSIGLSVDEADDGDTGLEKVKSTSYDYIYTDIKMPKMNGEEFLKEARNYQSSETRYVIITGGVTKDYNENLNKTLRSLVDAFIKKPFSIEEIEESIKNLKT